MIDCRRTHTSKIDDGLWEEACSFFSLGSRCGCGAVDRIRNSFGTHRCEHLVCFLISLSVNAFAYKVNRERSHVHCLSHKLTLLHLNIKRGMIEA